MMRTLSCLIGRLRRAMQPVEDTPQDRSLTAAVADNLRAAQRADRASQALDEVATLVKDHAHAGRR